MAYPSLKTAALTETPNDGRQVVRATNGVAKTRVLASSTKLSFAIEHRLSGSDKSTLQTFYGSNSGTSFDYVHPFGTSTYTCVFGAPAVQFDPQPGGWWLATVKLEEV